MESDIRLSELPSSSINPQIDKVDQDDLRQAQLYAIETEKENLLVKEIKQRILIRYVALICSVAAMIFMAIFAILAMQHYFFMDHFVFAPASLAVVSVVAPITSISAISIAILFGAFRRIKKKNMGSANMTSLAAEAMKSSLGS